MKKPDLQTEGVISFYDGVWILKYQNEFEERAEQKETTPERSMSFLDLKRSIPIAGNRRVPTYKRLLQEKQTIIAATSVGNAKITVYQNGYVIYEDGTRRTVMPIHRYGDYHYYFQDGIHVCIPEKEFENLRWELRFLMEGESRIEHNRKNCALRHEAFPCVMMVRIGAQLLWWTLTMNISFAFWRMRNGNVYISQLNACHAGKKKW